MKIGVFGKIFILLITFILFIFFLSLENQSFYNTEKLVGKKISNFQSNYLKMKSMCIGKNYFKIKILTNKFLGVMVFAL